MRSGPARPAHSLERRAKKLAHLGNGWHRVESPSRGTPCIGPTLAAILTLAASGREPALGAALLLTYAFGLAVPFFAVGMLVTRSLLASGELTRLGAITLLRRHQLAVSLTPADAPLRQPRP